MSQQTTNRYFDELASGLASGSISRGKAIRLMGAALLGGTLASFPGVAWAAEGGGGGRSSCAHFCQSLFGENTPEEEDCVSQGTKGQGPCFTCTTQTGCGPNFTPTCTVTGQTYNCSTCKCECPSGTEPCGGNCVPNCPAGQVRIPTTCACLCPPTSTFCGGNCLPGCPAGQVRDPTTCACVCSSGTTLCGGNCLPFCGAGQVRDPTTCACVCVPPFTVCGGNCLPPCSGGLVRDPTTCACV